MYSLGSLVLSVTMVIVALWIVNKFLKIFFKKKKLNVWGIGAWILFAVFQLMLELNKGNASIWNTIISVLLVFLISVGNYYWKGKNCILVVILFHVVWAFVEMLVFGAMSNLAITQQRFNLLGVMISKLIMIIGISLFSVYWKKSINQVVPTKYYIALLFVPIGSIYIADNTFNSVEHEGSTFSAMVTFSILLLLNIVIFEIYHKLSENFLLERERTVYVQQLEIVSRNTEEQKKIMENFHQEKHNWINELIVLKNCVENSDKNSVIENINRIIKVCDVNEKISNSGNNVVDAIINFKYAVAKELGITFQLKIFIPDNLPLNQCDLGIILGNAIDNAIDAVKNCKTYEKTIEISMGIKKEALVLMVKNPYEHMIKKDKKGNLISTKKEFHKHGYGVSSIKRVADQYAGEVWIDTQDHIFTLTVIINLK